MLEGQLEPSFRQEPSLRQQASLGVKWSFLSQGGRQIMQLFATALLARLLTPSDFGLVGMATIAIGFVGLFRDLGSTAALVQVRSLDEDMICSAFWMNALLGVLSTVSLFLLSPLVAIMLREPRVVPLLRVLSWSFLISGFTSVQQTLLQRQLAFGTLAKVETAAVGFGCTTAIGAAVLGLGVWSLILQSLVMAFSTTIFLWLAVPWRPRWICSIDRLREIRHYSLNLTGFNILNYFARNADNFLIGRYLGSQALGYYALAYRLMFFPIQSISDVIGRVTFPLYSQLQDLDTRLREAYIKVTAAIAFVTFPLMLGMMVTSDLLISTLFGKNWIPAVMLLTILAPIGLLQSIGTTVGAIYQAKGRTDWLLRWGIASGVVVTTAFLIGLHWGVVGVAAAYALASLALALPGLVIPLRLIHLGIRVLMRALFRPALCSLIMLAVVWQIKPPLLAALSSQVVLLTLVSLGMFVYFLASWWLNRDQFSGLLEALGMTP